MRIKYTILPLQNRGFGHKVSNGTGWTGALRNIFDGNITTIPIAGIYTRERLGSFDIAFPFLIAQPGFLHHKIQNQNGSLLSVFSQNIWIYLCFMTFIITVAFSMGQLLLSHIRRIPRSSSSTHQLLTDAVWTIVTMFTEQFDCNHGIIDQVSTRIILCFCGLLVVFVISLYQSSLLSSHLAGSQSYPFDGTGSLAELIRSGEHTMLDPNRSPYYFSMVQKSEKTAFVAMREALLVNPLQKIPIDSTVDSLIAKQPHLVIPISRLASLTYLQ